MIKTAEQALGVQKKRFTSGKKGVARAVRRWMVRETKARCQGMMDWHCYNDLKQELPFIDPHPLPEEEA